MTPERWARIKEVFNSAIDRPENERDAFLAEACGSDASLRQEVQRLLAAQHEPPVESPVAGVLKQPATPPLAAGSMLGRYRVEQELGEGGMGAVYRAYDTQLRRPVALKVLPPEYAADPERRERLLREARAASALSHPNIVGIYDAGAEAGVAFIAMEFVEGKTLGEAIPPRGLPLGQALDYAVQIASGLAKAHAAGVIHRDLKPGNIMLTGDGLVKLLDFGLARRAQPAGAETTLTVEGQILGTPSYMSPEQAQGEKADERSDIFAFGAVLYEMLTGRRAFSGGSLAAVLAAVLRDDLPQLTGVPLELERLIARCLRKDPARRFQHMDDVRLVLEDLREEAASRSPQPSAPVTPPRWRKPIWVAALGIVVAAAGLTLFILLRQARPEAGQMRVVPLTTYPGNEKEPTFSPDGKLVAFEWDGEWHDNRDIYVKLVGSGAPPLRLTTDPAPSLNPAWSPDGSQIAFLRRLGPDRSVICLVSPLGGPERKLADCPTWAQETLGMSWSPDGRWLAVPERNSQGATQVFLYPVGQGEKRQLTRNPSGVDHCPAFSPDGRHLAYASCASMQSCCVYVLEMGPDYLPKGQPQRVTRQPMYLRGIAWTTDGRSLVYSAGPWTLEGTYLWRVSVFPPGPPERMELPGPEARHPAISPAGNRLAYTRFGHDADIWKIEAGGAVQRFISSTRYEYAPEFSPDGRKIAFCSNRSGLMEIWICNRDGTNLVQLTDRPGVNQSSPRWSPDGRWIVFDSQDEEGHVGIYVVDAAGGRPRPITPPTFEASMPSWSRGGKWIYFASSRTGGFEIRRSPAAGGESTQITDHGGFHSQESPDGRTLYYTKEEVPTSLLEYRTPVFARPLSGGAERQVLDTVVWHAFFVVEDGIYCFAWRNKGLWPLEFYDFATQRNRILASVATMPFERLTVSPDRKTVLFGALTSTEADLMLIENFR